MGTLLQIHPPTKPVCTKSKQTAPWKDVPENTGHGEWQRGTGNDFRSRPGNSAMNTGAWWVGRSLSETYVFIMEREHPAVVLKQWHLHIFYIVFVIFVAWKPRFLQQGSPLLLQLPECHT